MSFTNTALAIDAREAQQIRETYNAMENPNSFKPSSSTNAKNATQIQNIGNDIVGALQIIGTVLSVVALGVLGIKYMIGSVDERAEYKRTLRPYLIGAIMVFGITNMLAIIVKITKVLF